MLEELGQVECALEVAGLVLDNWRKYELTTSWALKEIFEKVLKLAEEIEDAREWVEALREIAEEMAKVRMFEEALELVERIKDAWLRARALSEIAVVMAKAGMEEQAKEVFEKALKLAEGIEEAWLQARALRDIAVGMAKAGEVERAVGIVKQETGMRMEMLPPVLEALAERTREGDGKSKGGFLRLLPLCGWSLKLAYQACGLLAWFYPERVEEIAKVVMGE